MRLQWADSMPRDVRSPCKSDLIWKGRLCRCDWVKDLAIGRHSWFIQMSPKRNDMYPQKGEAGGPPTHTGEGNVARGRDWGEAATSQGLPAASAAEGQRARSPREPPGHPAFPTWVCLHSKTDVRLCPQSCGRAHFSSFQPSSLWSFVPASTRN